MSGVPQLHPNFFDDGIHIDRKERIQQFTELRNKIVKQSPEYTHDLDGFTATMYKWFINDEKNLESLCTQQIKNTQHLCGVLEKQNKNFWFSHTVMIPFTLVLGYYLGSSR